MSNFKDTVTDAGKKIVDGARQAADYVKEKTGLGGPTEGSDAGVAAIRPHMAVISSCGCTMGKVDHVDGSAIKLTKNDSPDGQHHFVPTGWVDHVDSHVHMRKNADEMKREWKSDAASCRA